MPIHPVEPSDRVRLAVDGATNLHFGDVRIRNRGRLPHWEKEGGLRFVTFRLCDSLPLAELEKIVERQRVLRLAQQSGLKLLPQQKALVEEFSPKKMEEYFDRGAGTCYLRDPRIAELMTNALRFHNGTRYRLLAWCVMPNHVHVVARFLPDQELAVVLRSWKAYTARMANRLLGRSGEFWQREYYDRLIRGAGELEHALKYIEDNPVRAGLIGWKWVWSAGIDPSTTAGLESLPPRAACRRPGL